MIGDDTWKEIGKKRLFLSRNFPGVTEKENYVKPRQIFGWSGHKEKFTTPPLRHPAY
jgi:hypothetical protein